MLKKIFKLFFKSGVDKTESYAIIEVQKENNLQIVLGTNTNKEVSYERYVAAKAGQGRMWRRDAAEKVSTQAILLKEVNPMIYFARTIERKGR